MPVLCTGKVVRFSLLWVITVATGSALASPQTPPRFPVWPTLNYRVEPGEDLERRSIRKLGPTDRLFLWRVDGEYSTVFLMGSIHALKEQNYPLAPMYEYTYDMCDQLVVENYDPKNSTEQLMPYILLPAGRKLGGYISSEAYDWITGFVDDNGLPTGAFDIFKPRLVEQEISYLKAEQAGVHHYLGVDYHFIDKARADEKPILSLEGEERNRIFNTPLDSQAQSLEALIDVIQEGKLEGELNQMINLWVNREQQTMEDMVVERQKIDPLDYNVVLRDRNLAWISNMEKYLELNKTSLVVAGCLHFFGEHSVLKLLEERGHRISQIDNVEPPEMSFALAIKEGVLQTVNTYLQIHPNINAHYQDDSAPPGSAHTPLHTAAVNNQMDVAKLLVEAGAYLDVGSVGFKATPMYLASRRGHLNMVKYLLKTGADSGKADVDGRTPLHAVVLSSPVSMDVAECLIDQGAIVDVQDKEGYTPLHHAANSENLELCKLLISNGANPFSRTHKGKTPRDLAMEDTIVFEKEKHAWVVEYLKSFVPPTKSLHQAAIENDLEQLKRHIYSRTKLDARDQAGWMPLHYTAFYGYLDFAETLLANKASVEVILNSGATPLHLATQEGMTEMAGLLIANNANVNARGNHGSTPLHKASEKGNLQLVKILVNNNASLNATNDYGNTPLYWAIRQGHNSIADYLIDEGADVNAKSKTGHTALHNFAYNNRIEAAKSIINRGAIPNGRTSVGLTPLHLAVQAGHVGMVELLVKSGSKTDMRSNKGESALDMATLGQHTRIQKLLKDMTVRISNFRYTGVYKFKINGRKGATFIIESSDNLENWSGVNQLINNGDFVEFSDPSPVAHKKRFYRVRLSGD